MNRSAIAMYAVSLLVHSRFRSPIFCARRLRSDLRLLSYLLSQSACVSFLLKFVWCFFLFSLSALIGWRPVC